MNADEVLKIAIDSGMIDVTTLERRLIERENMKYLEKHTHRIWQGKNGRWLTYLDVDGKRKLISKATEEELNKFLISYYKEGDENPKVEEIFYEWLGKKLSYGEIEPQTYDRYEKTYIQLIKDGLGNRRINSIKDIELEDYIKQTIHDKELKYKAWSNMRTLLIGIWKYAYKRKFTRIRITEFMEDLGLSPKIFKKKTDSDEENVFTDSEAEMIIEHIYKMKHPNKTDLGIALALFTGLRAGEIITLKKSDIDKTDRTLNVSRTEIHYKVNGKVHYEVRESTKGRDGKRIVYLTDEAIRILDILCAWSDEDNLFETHEGSLTNRLYRICNQLNIRKRSLHKCRKTYATRLINNGVSDNLVAKMLGHTKPSTTYKYYVYNSFDKEKEKQIITSISLS